MEVGVVGSYLLSAGVVGRSCGVVDVCVCVCVVVCVGVRGVYR